MVPASASARVADVVAATLSSFIDCEQKESLDTVADLVGAARRVGLGAAGTAATIEALRRGQADVLVMAGAYLLMDLGGSGCFGTQRRSRTNDHDQEGLGDGGGYSCPEHRGW